MSSCSGMYQNQPFLFGGLDDQRRAFVAAGVAVGALPVRPDRALVQHRVPQPQLEPVLQQAVLAAGVDDHLGAHLAARAAFGLDRDADAPRSPSNSTSSTRTPSCTSTPCSRALSSIICVELAADDLPGLRALVRLVVPEVERRRQLAGGVDELHAVLLDEVALLHLRQHVEPLEHPVRLGDQRLADVEARKVLALEELDAVARAGRAASRRSSPPGPPPMTTTSGFILVPCMGARRTCISQPRRVLAAPARAGRAPRGAASPAV